MNEAPTVTRDSIIIAHHAMFLVALNAGLVSSGDMAISDTERSMSRSHDWKEGRGRATMMLAAHITKKSRSTQLTFTLRQAKMEAAAIVEATNPTAMEIEKGGFPTVYCRNFRNASSIPEKIPMWRNVLAGFDVAWLCVVISMKCGWRGRSPVANLKC